MNIKKNILAIILAITSLLTTTGCMDSEELIPTQENSEIQENDIEANDDEPKIDPLPLIILKYENNKIAKENMRDELIDMIKRAKSKSEEDGDLEIHQYYKISDIKEFYFPCDFKGFELNCIEITKTIYNYYYTPIYDDPKKAEEHRFSYSTDILLSIYRSEWFFEREKEVDPFKDTIKQASERGWIYVEEDNMVYSPVNNFIFARMDNTMVDITVPAELSDYETLRDLANQVIKSAELVVVGE